MAEKNLDVQYFAILREKTGKSSESLSIDADTPNQRYDALDKQYHFNLHKHSIQVAINDEFSSWDQTLNPNDKIVFIPPVAGG